MKSTTVIAWVAAVLCAVASAWAALHFQTESGPDYQALLYGFESMAAGDWSFPADTAMAIVTVLIMWFAAAGLGHWALERYGGARALPSLWSRWVLAVLVGWIALSLGTLWEIASSCVTNPRFDYLRLDDPKLFLSAIRETMSTGVTSSRDYSSGDGRSSPTQSLDTDDEVEVAPSPPQEAKNPQP